jgi:hypothetical protein
LFSGRRVGRWNRIKGSQNRTAILDARRAVRRTERRSRESNPLTPTSHKIKSRPHESGDGFFSLTGRGGGGTESAGSQNRSSDFGRTRISGGARRVADRRAVIKSSHPDQLRKMKIASLTQQGEADFFRDAPTVEPKQGSTNSPSDFGRTRARGGARRVADRRATISANPQTAGCNGGALCRSAWSSRPARTPAAWQKC